MSLLFALAWKSALIAALALALTALMRGRPAAERVRVLQLALWALVLAPALSLLAPPLTIETPAPTPMASEVIVFTPVLDTPAPGFSIERALLAVYTGVACLLLAYVGVGLLTLRRWVRAARPIAAPAWLDALRRLALTRVRLLAADQIGAPMSCGWLKPVILIDRKSLAREADALPILAHEAAHVRRGDWLALLVGRLVTTLYWFNPLVWLVTREADRLAEEAADQEAARFTDPAHYAQALLDCAVRVKGAALANSMAVRPSELGARVRLVLEPGGLDRRANVLLQWSAAAVLGVLAVTISVTQFSTAQAAPTQSAIAEAADQGDGLEGFSGRMAAFGERMRNRDVSADNGPRQGAPASDASAASVTDDRGTSTMMDAASAASAADDPAVGAVLAQNRPVASAGRGYSPRVRRDLENAARMRLEAQELRAEADDSYSRMSGARSAKLRQAQRLEDRARYLDFRAEMRRRWDADHPEHGAIDPADEVGWEPRPPPSENAQN